MTPPQPWSTIKGPWTTTFLLQSYHRATARQVGSRLLGDWLTFTAIRPTIPVWTAAAPILLRADQGIEWWTGEPSS